MVDDVAAYPWSSYGLRADWLKEPNWLDMDPCFIELGQTAEERYRRYVTFTPVTAVKGRCPRPLDEGDETFVGIRKTNRVFPAIWWS